MSEQKLPGHEDQPADIMCPSCGRFVGALTRCPHCGAGVQKRLSVRFFRYAALLLGTVGLWLLYMMATHREIPLVKVGDIRPTMNFAYVRVAGTVSGEARVFKEGGRVRSMRFLVDDGSGEISVTAYRAQAEAIVEANQVPRRGDRIEVAGSLSVTADDEIVMRLQMPEHLKLSRADVPVTPLGDISPAMVGDSLMVEGEIVDVFAPRSGSKAPWRMTLRDASGQKDLTFWEEAYAEMADKVLLKAGSPVRAHVSVRTYKEQLQLSLNSGMDLEFVEAGSPANLTAGPGAPKYEAEAVEIGALTAALSGKVVKVTGRVAEFKRPEAGTKAPYEFSLQEGDKRVRVVYWDTVAKHLGANEPVDGALMSVRGMVDVYKDNLQIKVNHSDQVRLLNVSPASAPAAAAGAEVKVQSITRAKAGQTCVVKGVLGEPDSIKGGVIYPLSDGSGSIKVVLWDRAVPGPDRDRLKPGLQVTVSGEVQDYKGSLEIVPPNAQAIVVEQAER